MNKKGFISTALIYTFFIIFLILMVFLLNNYSSTKFMTDRFRYDIQEELYELSNADININVFVYNPHSKEYEYIDYVPTSGTIESNISYCKNKSSISYENGEITITAKERDYCYLYFKVSELISIPVITANDNIESNMWHKSATKLSFSGSKIFNGNGEVIYYYGNSVNNMTNTGNATDFISLDGSYDYYVKACNSLNLSMCSNTAEYVLKIDSHAPSCSISGNTSATTANKTLAPNGEDSGEGTVYYSWDNKNNYSTTKSNKKVTANGTYTLYVKDGVGNETSCNVKVTTIATTKICWVPYNACAEDPTYGNPDYRQHCETNIAGELYLKCKCEVQESNNNRLIWAPNDCKSGWTKRNNGCEKVVGINETCPDPKALQCPSVC